MGYGLMRVAWSPSPTDRLHLAEQAEANASIEFPVSPEQVAALWRWEWGRNWKREQLGSEQLDYKRRELCVNDKPNRGAA
jgi:hypothetical protein